VNPFELAPEEDALVRPPAEGPEPVHRLLGMTDGEYDLVVRILGREPRPAELAMYSVMWSEHCSYKSSRLHLARFPTRAPWVVVGPGENAGVVDLGDGWCAAIRIESHNHPSYVEPYEGAATGVGGILRDVFTMGARPVALWDALRFGSLDQSHNRYLLGGVVAGVAGYGNAVGVPTVGGELELDDTYSGNPLVNVMCLGILRREDLVLGTSGPPGTVAVLLGNATGRDGIGGASVLASAGFYDATGTKRPSVQVGDPFEEKKLIEACLELYARKLVVGVQDLGAAGLSCATSEPAARAGTGMTVDLDAVHVREPGMTAAELLMSESQERMLAFVDPARVGDVLEVARRWEIDASVIGEVTADPALRVHHGGELVAEVPAASLTDDAPRYDRPYGEPRWLADLWANTLDHVVRPGVADVLLRLLDDPSVASTAWVSEQYDSMLFLNTVVGPGHDAALLRLEDTGKGLAVSVDGNGRLCYLDPRRGAARIVYEAALNVALTGARPLAVVDNLNLGNPEKPDVMWQLRETIEGISQACEALGVPVVGGNVSLYNETDGADIYPTPVVGLLGVADPLPARPPRLDRAEEGMELWLLGPEEATNLAGSTFERTVFGHVGGRPTAPDPTLAAAVTTAARSLAVEGVAAAAHDVSEGGLAVAAAEIAIASGVGLRLWVPDWRSLFSEDPHRLLVAVEPGDAGAAAALAGAAGAPARRVGIVGGTDISFDLGGVHVAVDLSLAAETYRGALARRMG